MLQESPAFTKSDIAAFVTDYFEHERSLLIERLSKVVEETVAIAKRIQERPSPTDDSWSASETLAHMVTSSQYFGWLIHQIATKQEPGDILSMLQMRDAASSQAVNQPIDDLVDQFRTNIERTIAFIEKVDYLELRATFDYVGIQMTGEDLVRIPLCSHLESHIEQMQEALKIG
ncbi:MAG: DinB family protein [Actinomycetota bacterium]|nr:DinB family protein [Actinomycetota bacterium]